VNVEVAPDVMQHGFLLVPPGSGPKPAVLVVFYAPEVSVAYEGPEPLTGQAKKYLAGNHGEGRDFALQLAKRGFVTLSIGTPGDDAYHPDLYGMKCQPLSQLAYIAANCHTVLAQRPEVDPQRIGVMGHSYGGKWAMFASCLYEKFACAVWSDGGVVFDESRQAVNYWEPWYLGLDPAITRKRGLITAESPRTGPYKTIVESGHDLLELHALMAPRPFLVSGGSEDRPERWVALNHAVAVNRFLGYYNRVAFTSRPAHSPTPESNEQAFLFLDHFLGAGRIAAATNPPSSHAK
jgi:dienelactone hydrolase